MELAASMEIVAFAVFALFGVGGALGMTTTMSMFRSAIFLMVSFVGVAGLFILLLADLIGVLQVMMYVGGMLVMALFMVLMSGDPGGEQMSSMMSLPKLERFFSLGLRRDEDDPAVQGEMTPMFTDIKRPAAVLASLVGAALLALVLLRRGAWAEVSAQPDPRSAERIGELLMGEYMIAFEGAGLLILLGIFGAVWLARSGRHPDATSRAELRAAIDDPPPPASDDPETP